VVKPFILVQVTVGVGDEATQHVVLVIEVVEGCQLLFGSTPGRWDGYFPIQARGDGITFGVFSNFVIFVAPKVRVGQFFPDDGIPDPIQETPVLAIGNLGFIHPERSDRYFF